MRRSITHYPQGENLTSDYATGIPLADTTTATPVAGTVYAQYLGRAPQALTKVDLFFYVGTGGAAGVGYAELGIATGDPKSEISASIPLTIVGWANIAANVLGANTSVVAAVSDLAIPAGVNLWGLFTVSASAQPGMRVPFGNDYTGRRATCTSTARPSTSLGTTKTFTNPTGWPGLPGYLIGARFRWD